MRKSLPRRDQYSPSPTPVLSAEIGKPLWVVDGIEVAPDFINKLDPNRIENITVLKDQSAVATYGQEARNGVVIITTKGDTALPARPENARQEHGKATTQAEAHGVSSENALPGV